MLIMITSFFGNYKSYTQKYFLLDPSEVKLLNFSNQYIFYIWVRNMWKPNSNEQCNNISGYSRKNRLHILWIVWHTEYRDLPHMAAYKK
jgi:hypothetical protein